MSTKHVFEMIADTKVVYPVMWTYDICAFDNSTYYDLSTKITIFCNDVNKASTSSELLAINSLHYMSKK